MCIRINITLFLGSRGGSGSTHTIYKCKLFHFSEMKIRYGRIAAMVRPDKHTHFSRSAYFFFFFLIRALNL